MLKPSDFNNAVPQFQNGNYASNPINPQYVEEPSSTDYNRGAEPLQTLPAQWWNWFINKFTSRFNKVNIYVKNLFNELAQLLSLVNVTPDGTEGSVTDGQLKNAFKELYPTYVSDKLELGTTYVPQTREVNGHALTGNVTVSKSDVELGNVVNTGDSAIPVSGGLTKFTTGGAYTELAKKADLLDLAPTFSASTYYPEGSYVIYNGNLYRCTVAHSAGAWNSSQFTQVAVSDELADIYTALNTYRSSTYYNETAGEIYCNVARISTYSVNENINHSASMQVRLRLYDSSFSKPVTADVTMSVRGRGSTLNTVFCQCNSILDGNANGVKDFDKGHLFAKFSQNGTVFTIDLYYRFTSQWQRINVEVLSVTRGDIASTFTKAGGDLPMTISTELTGTNVDIYFASTLPPAPSAEGVYFPCNNVNSSGYPSYSWVNATPVPAQNSNNLFTTGGAFDFFGGNTKASAWLGRVFGWALGRNWTRVTDLDNVRKIFYLNKMWFAISDTLGILWSIDGKTWTQGTGYDTGLQPWNTEISYGNGLWIICADEKKLYWSDNGKSWNLGTLSGTLYSQHTPFEQASYGNNIWVAASFYDGLWWSTDGKNWTQVTGTTKEYIFPCVKYADGIFVAGSNSYGLWWSTDGKNWTQSTDYTDSTIRHIFYENGIWFADNSMNHALYYSEDGKSWSTTNVSDDINCCCYFNNTWYFGGNNDCYYSLDGHTLIQMNTSLNDVLDIVYANTVMLVRTDRTGLYLSTDYKTFEKVISWNGSKTGRVVYADGMFCTAILLIGILVSDYTNADIQ